MIQIDDAGSGSLIGGTYIGVLRTETGQYYSDVIPITLYNQENFKKKYYLDYACTIVEDAFMAMDVKNSEEIQICQGYMFDEVRKYLHDKGYNYTSTSISNPLQSIVEKSFENYSVSLGLYPDFVKYTRYPFHFHRLLRWVYADYNNRQKYCKTGWKSWKKYGHLQLVTYTDYVYSSNYYCLKCGKRIDSFSSVKVIKYVSNAPNIIYLHSVCP